MYTNFQHFFTRCGIVILTISFIFPTIQTFAQKTVLTTEYQEDKSQIQQSIANINSVLQERGASLLSITERKNTLQAVIAAKEKNIQEINDNITQARIIESQIADQIRINEEKRDLLYSQMENIVPLLQKEARKTQLQVVIESQNIAQLIRRVNGLSTLQIELNQLDEQIEDINKELEESKIQQEEILKTLEGSAFLLKSEQDSLQLLLDQTQGEEATYQQLIADLNSQRATREAEIARLDQEYQSELERIRIEEEQRRIEQAQRDEEQNNNGNGNSSGETSITSPTPIPDIPLGSCRFEDGRQLGVRLASPTTGYISDTFGCPSLTGRWHDGYDIANGLGTPIVAAYGGVIERKGYESGGFGNYVLMRHNAGGQTFFTLYAHLISQSPIPVGQIIGQGGQIGQMGSTGWSTGPHLHFMIYSDSYISTGSLGCVYGNSKCFNPGKFTNL